MPFRGVEWFPVGFLFLVRCLLSFLDSPHSCNLSAVVSLLFTLEKIQQIATKGLYMQRKSHAAQCQQYVCAVGSAG
jgi:hypothetical protein